MAGRLLVAHSELLDLPSLPLEDPVLVFTVALAVFLIGPLAIERLGQPGIVGIVLLGAILGPGGLDVVAHVDAIVLLGNVGLVYLLFTVGLELDLRRFRENPESAALFGLVSFGLPFALGGAVVGLWLGLDVPAAALLAAVFASHTLLAYPVVNQLGITGNRAVTAVFGGILFTDSLALLVLALVRAAVDGGGLTVGVAVAKVLTLVVLVAGVWVVVPPIARWFFRSVSEESYFEFLFVAVAFFAAASAAQLLGVAPILGAFVGGLALNRLVPQAGTLMRRIEFVGNALFVPFFLLHVGMLVDFSVVLAGTETLFVAAVVVGVMVATKWVAAWLVARIQGYTPEERGVIFGLSIGQAAAALAITLVGYDAGLFDATILNAVVLMLLVTAVASPALVRRAGRALALAGEIDASADHPAAPRLLVPVTHAGDRQRHLVEFAFLLRGAAEDEPVHLLTVVDPNGPGETADAIERQQAELDDLALLGSDAEVPVQTEVRVNRNPADGIVTGAVETRADVVLVGWSPSGRFQRRMFGDVIDQLLQGTTLPVHVASLRRPVNTTERFYVVVPPGIEHHEGFLESVHYVKAIAAALGATPIVLVVGETERQYERLFERVEPELAASFRTVGGWGRLYDVLAGEAGEHDLVTVVSARRGELGWHDALATLPRRLTELPPESFVLVYPRSDDPEYDRRFLRWR